MVSLGVLFLGVLKPNAAIVLGENNRAPCLVDISKIFLKPPSLIWIASSGFFSPFANKKDDRWDIRDDWTDYLIE